METVEVGKERRRQGDAFFKMIIMFLVGVLVFVLIALFVVFQFKLTEEYTNDEIAAEQYKSIQADVMQGGKNVEEGVRQALRDDKITREEYNAIKASAANISKAEIIEQIKADAGASSN